MIGDLSRRLFLKAGLLAPAVPLEKRDERLIRNARDAESARLAARMRYREIMESTPVLDLFGLPHSWWHVGNGFHPFSPQRVVVINEPFLPRWLQKSAARILGDLKADKNWIDVRLRPEKIALIFHMIYGMTSYYGVPTLAESWTNGLVKRESLGSCGLGAGFALVHQFQDKTPIRTDNGIVDWWLFLVPGGVDYEALDQQPVHALVGHVFATSHTNWGRQLGVWEITGHLHRSVGSSKWIEVSRMDRGRAATQLNYQLADCLATTDESWIVERRIW